MAKLILYGVRSNSAAQNTTRYFSFGDGGVVFSLTEVSAQRTARAAGVYSNLYARVTANTIAASSTVKFRKNTADGASSFTVPSTTTGTFEDTTHTETISAGNAINGAVVAGASGANTLVFSIMGAAFTPTTNTVTTHIATLNATVTTASATRFHKWVGAESVVSSETATEKFKAKVVGTLKNAGVAATSNARVNSTSFNIRINGANSTITVAIGSGVTGYVEDTSNTQAVAVGDLLSRSIVTGSGTQALNAALIATDFETTSGSVQAANGVAAQAYAANTTRYEGIHGVSINATTETDVKAKAGVAGMASLYEVYVSANTLTSDASATFRINGADGTGAVVLTNGATGWFEDTSHIDVFAAADEINWKITTAAGGTSMTLEYLAVVLSTPTLSAGLGAMVIAAAAAGLRVGRAVLASLGTVAVAGTTAGLVIARRLVADTGPMAITGSAATLVYHQEAVLAANRGQFSLDGTDVTFRRTYILAAQSGAVAIAGSTTRLSRNYPLSADSGAMVLTGRAATLVRNVPLGASSAAVVLSGTDASFHHAYRLAAQSDAVLIDGSAAGLIPSGLNSLTASRGTFAVTGTDATLRITRRIGASTGAVDLAGRAAGFPRTYRIIGATGAIDVVVRDTGTHLQMLAHIGAFLLDATDALLARGYRLDADTGGFIIAPYDTIGANTTTRSTLLSTLRYHSSLVAAVRYASSLVVTEP